MCPSVPTASRLTHSSPGTIPLTPHIQVTVYLSPSTVRCYAGSQFYRQAAVGLHNDHSATVLCV
nr:MAG TPA: hypothetical protein [Caudoviricetes sp.]